MTDMDVTFSGKFFDNAAWDAGMDHLMRDGTMDIADEGVRDIRVNLSQVLKHPTGYYESKIRAREQPFSTSIVDDAGVIYGMWLEGIGSRNAPVTRFKGYSTFKRTTPRLQSKAVRLFRPSLERFIAEINS